MYPQLENQCNLTTTKISESCSNWTSPIRNERKVCYNGGENNDTTAIHGSPSRLCGEDMEKALKYWTEYLKVGPFFMFEHCPLENQRYRGGESNADVSLALGNSGDVQIELIYCENDAPSVYKEFLDAGKTGVHHFGMMPENFEKACKEYSDRDTRPLSAQLVESTGFFDTVDSIGHFIELWIIIRCTSIYLV